MFSDQYKKDNEKLVLDQDFVERLKIDMRKEQARLQSEAANNTMSNSKQQPKVSRTLNTSHWKHTLPIALSACAALAIIVTVPNLMNDEKKSDCSESSIAESACDSAANEEMDTYTMDKSTEFADGTTEAASESTTSDEANDTFADGASEEKAEESPKLDTIPPVIIENSEETNKQNAGTSFSITAAQSYPGAGNIDYSADSFDLSVQNDYVPTDTSTLTEMSKLYQSFAKGADQVSLDYAYDGRLILHDYYGLIVYDYEVQELLRIVDLPTRIGGYTTQGDTALTVQVFEGGNYLLLDYNAVDDSGYAICYLYDVQTDIMAKISKEDYQSLSIPAMDQHLTYDSERFDDLILPGNRSNAQSQLDEQRDCILFYQSMDCDTIASLSVCIRTQRKDTTQSEISIQPIFGEHAISDVRKAGYALDGLIK